MLIAGFGYQVIVPDALYHGERGTIENSNPSNMDKYIWEIIFKSIEESDVSINKNILPSSEIHKDEIDLYDPMTNEEKIKERAISIFHGVEDSSVPIEIQKQFFDKMRPHYINSQDKLQLIEFSNVNHRITTSMLENLITWLKANL